MTKRLWRLGGLTTVMVFVALVPFLARLQKTTPKESVWLGYTFGFFFLWALGAGSSAFTCWLQRRADEVNRDAIQLCRNA